MLLGVMRLLGTRSLVVGVAVASLVCPGARLGSGIGTWITEWAGAVREGLIWDQGCIRMLSVEVGWWLVYGRMGSAR